MPEKVIVITGASSGIGQAAALRLAKSGTKLVLAARGETALEVVASKCRQLGAEAVIVPTDVSDYGQVQSLALRAVEVFGRIDVWINNASVISYDYFLSITPEKFRRVMDVNVMGCMYGSQAALTQFKLQKSGGTLINVGSAYGMFPAPYVSAYVTSKFAVRGFTASLRQEMNAEGHDNIHISTVMPATVDTPIYHLAANTTGRQVNPLPPAYPAAVIAKVIVRQVHHPRAEVIAGKAAYFPARLYGIAPSLAERIMGWYVDRQGFSDAPIKPGDGNLYQSQASGSISGGWPVKVPRIGKIISASLLAGGLSWWLWRRKTKEIRHD